VIRIFTTTFFDLSDALIKAQFYYRYRIKKEKSKELRTYNSTITNYPDKVLQTFL